MGDAVWESMAELDNLRSVGMDAHAISWQSDGVRAAVDGFVKNLAAAIVIVVLVRLVFMGLRAGLIIGAVLLLTVARMIIIMNVIGIAMHSSSTSHSLRA